MPYRARFELESGDRGALEATVARLRELADRKGADVTGPHARPTRRVDVPMYLRHDATAPFRTWRYRVYTRHLEVVGHESVTRAIANVDVDPAVGVSLRIEPADAVRQE
ncbi:MAG: 30S ribosomal protein S10 [Halobacteriales archaeon]